MGILSKLVKLNAFALAGGAGLTVYAYPELREDPHQLVRAGFRSLRCAKAGALMAYDYFYVRKADNLSFRQKRSTRRCTSVRQSACTIASLQTLGPT